MRSNYSFSGKRIISFLLLLCFAASEFAFPAPASEECPFDDLEDGAYYRGAVLRAVGRGITNGTAATTFSPENVCTRAQIVTFLWRAK